MTRLRVLSFLALAALLALAWTAPHQLRRIHSASRQVVARIEAVPAHASVRIESSPSTELEAAQIDGTPAPADAQDDKSISVEERFVVRSGDGTGLIVLPEGEERDFVALDPGSAHIFDGIDLGGDELECYLDDTAPVERTPRVWVRARVRAETSDPEEGIHKGTLLDLLSVDPISKEWMQAYKVCRQQVDSLVALAHALPSPSKAARVVTQRDLAVTAFQDLRAAPDGPSLPERLAHLVKGREWTHGEEDWLRGRILEATEPVGLAPEGDCWVRGAPGWSDPLPAPPRPIGVTTQRERAQQELERFGMQVKDLDADERKILVLADGIRVLRVDPFSPAARGGVCPGDVLQRMTCTDYRPSSTEHLSMSFRVGMAPVSDFDPSGNHPFFLTFLRGGELMRVKIEPP